MYFRFVLPLRIDEADYVRLGLQHLQVINVLPLINSKAARMNTRSCTALASTSLVAAPRAITRVNVCMHTRPKKGNGMYFRTEYSLMLQSQDAEPRMIPTAQDIIRHSVGICRACCGAIPAVSRRLSIESGCLVDIAASGCGVTHAFQMEGRGCR